MTPGPSVLLATANSMNYGLKKTIGTICGDLSANLIQIALATSGLAAIVISSAQIFNLIKWLGVAYLIYMGISNIISKTDFQLIKEKKENISYSKLYSEGFLMSASNPKAIVFFAALFPLFIDPNLPFLFQVLVLSLTFIFMDGSSLLFYGLFAHKLKAHLEDSEKMHLQNKIVGSLLIFAGIMLTLVKRT